MTNLGLPERQSPSDDWLQQGSNALGLDESKLRTLAHSIQAGELTREELGAIYYGEQNDRNPLLMVWIDDAAQLQAERVGLDGRSFRRGAALAIHLLSETSEQGIPFMGMDARAQASAYLKRPDTPGVMHTACCDLLKSQTELSNAFNIALEGVPEDTDSTVARFGGGLALLGVMSAAHYGGANVKIELPE